MIFQQGDPIANRPMDYCREREKQKARLRVTFVLFGLFISFSFLFFGGLGNFPLIFVGLAAVVEEFLFGCLICRASGVFFSGNIFCQFFSDGKAAARLIMARE